MNLKYMPLGTVCKTNNVSNKLMVIGYNENGNDYVAINYPEGINISRTVSYFNHDDIIELYSYGYKNDEWNEYNQKTLKRVEIPSPFVEVKEEQVIPSPFVEVTPVVEDTMMGLGLQFDENGIVISDSTIDLPVEKSLEVSFAEEDIPTVASPYQFDENGVVINDWTTTPVPEPPKYKFDENGIVISEEMRTLPDIGVQPYQFDENGIVISDGMNVFEQPKLDIKFDENGVVISEGGITLETNKEISIDEPIITSTEVYQEETNVKFDANGMVITNEIIETKPVSEEIVNSIENAEVPVEAEIAEKSKKEGKKKKGFFGFGK